MALYFKGNRQAPGYNRSESNPMPRSMSEGEQKTDPVASGTNRGQGMPVDPGTDAFTVKNTQTKHRTPGHVPGRPHEQR